MMSVGEQGRVCLESGSSKKRDGWMSREANLVCDECNWRGSVACVEGYERDGCVENEWNGMCRIWRLIFVARVFCGRGQLRWRESSVGNNGHIKKKVRCEEFRM